MDAVPRTVAGQLSGCAVNVPSGARNAPIDRLLQEAVISSDACPRQRVQARSSRSQAQINQRLLVGK